MMSTLPSTRTKLRSQMSIAQDSRLAVLIRAGTLMSPVEPGSGETTEMPRYVMNGTTASAPYQELLSAAAHDRRWRAGTSPLFILQVHRCDMTRT